MRERERERERGKNKKGVSEHVGIFRGIKGESLPSLV